MADCILETEKMLVLQAQLGEWDNLNHLLVCKKTNKAVIVDILLGSGLMCVNRMVGSLNKFGLHIHIGIILRA